MNKIFSTFLHKFSFQRQLEITVALGIFMLALFSSAVGSWQANERVRSNLLEQSRHITENLARDSALGLVYASAENAADAANAILHFPDVVAVEIRDGNQKILLKRGETDSAEFKTQARLVANNLPAGEKQGAAFLDAESPNAWRFVAPVYSQPSSSPFHEEVVPELLGHVTVVMSKAALTRMSTGIFMSNLGTSFSFALLLLLLIRFLTRRMTQPLNQLSACMGRAEAGESQVRATLAGPQDIAKMAHAFNSMMSVLEQHAAETQQFNVELEQRVAQRTAQLEASNKELAEFSYSMSHDMRTPLRALDGFSNILLTEHADGLDDEGKRLLKVLRDNARRMGRLVDDILHYLSLGRRKINFNSVDIAKLASEIVNKLQAPPPAPRLRLEIGPLPPAWGDSDMLGEVVANLLSNAVKFSSSGSETLIEIGGTANNGENCYYVRDHGVGFDMRYADKLFKVFERVHPTGQYEGSGIGLAIVKRIVERHGGRAWAEGKINEGATIYFVLPTKEASNG